MFWNTSDNKENDYYNKRDHQDNLGYTIIIISIALTVKRMLNLNMTDVLYVKIIKTFRGLFMSKLNWKI